MSNFCSNCGTKQDTASNFCINCGVKLNLPGDQSPKIISDSVQASKITESRSKIPFKSLIVLAFLGLLAATNPPKEKHITEVNETVKRVINKNATKDLFSSSNNGEKLFGGLGLLFGEQVTSTLTEKLVTRQNFFFLSMTELLYKGDEIYIGIGILGNVFIFKDFEKSIETKYTQLNESNESPESDNKQNDFPSTFDSSTSESIDTTVDWNEVLK